MHEDVRQELTDRRDTLLKKAGWARENAASSQTVADEYTAQAEGYEVLARHYTEVLDL